MKAIKCILAIVIGTILGLFSACTPKEEPQPKPDEPTKGQAEERGKEGEKKEQTEEPAEKGKKSETPEKEEEMPLRGPMME